MRKIAFTSMALAAMFGAMLQAQSPAWKEFSIGPPTQGNNRFNYEGLRAQGIPLVRAISRAYGISESRILGPGWVGSERYAITALVSEPQDFQPLFQRELGQRFNLKVHRENQEMDVFVLKTIEGSPRKLAEATLESAFITSQSGPDGMNLHFTPISLFVTDLEEDVVHRPVINETGLTGRYDFVFSWLPASELSLKTAIKEALGLQLVNDKRTVELLVIDSIEKLKVPR